MDVSTPVAASPTSPEVQVEVAGVVKRYPLFGRRRDRALAFLGRTGGLAYKTALDGVSLTAHAGEAVGIIGENGSGKSTLLRLVAGISAPDAGTVRTSQPVAAILELGLGFHPEFTGRENAELYGALIGVPEATMRGRLGDVLAFAELGEFVDQPLRTYSSGMAARLAFAVATHVEPQVLVVDEALAVGDGAFQRKCIDRMVRFKDEQRTVLFCSHAMYLVAAFCEQALWLHEGRVKASGVTRDVIHAYEDYLRHRAKRTVAGDQQAAVPPGSLASLRGVVLEPESGDLLPGDPLLVRVRLRRAIPHLPINVAVSFEDENGLMVAAFASHWSGHPPLAGAGEEEVTLRIPSCPLARGNYDVTVYLADSAGLQFFDQALLRRALSIRPDRWHPGLIAVEHQWEADGWR
jgi:lipopolysaccharide transport system ATP-binding protein